MGVMASNRVRYIEEFWSSCPDWANEERPSGDADWLPAFRRAAAEHVLAASSYEKRILVGDSQSRYEMGGKLDLFGIHLEALYPGVELAFTAGTDGIHIHSGGTSLDVPPQLVGKSGPVTLIGLTVVGTRAVGTRGVIVQTPSILERAAAQDWGWHGIHVTADVKRTPEHIDGGKSNANRTHLRYCSAKNVGAYPGTDARLVTATNPEGRREFGSGLRLSGNDVNICSNEYFHCVSAAGWAIDDTAFLGNIHIMPDCNLCGHLVQEWETGTAFPTYGVPVGSKLNLAYRVKNDSARGLLVSPYVETQNPAAIIDVPPPSLVISGIGGAKQPTTRTLHAGALSGTWKAEAGDKSVSVTLGEGAGAALSLASPVDGPIRLKYVPFIGDDPANTMQSPSAAGWWRMDLKNLDSAVYLYWTGNQSYEKKSNKELIRKLDPGRLVLGTHYRSGGGAIREQLCGTAATLVAIESAYPAAGKQRGDAYTCLAPVVGGVHTAVVVEEAGVKRWAPTGVVQ